MNQKQFSYWLQKHSKKIGELTGLVPASPEGLSAVHSNVTEPRDNRLYDTSISQAIAHQEIEPPEEGELFLEHTLKTVMQGPDGQLFLYERTYDNPCCCAYCMFGIGGATVGAGAAALIPALAMLSFPVVFVLSLLIPFGIGRRNRRDPENKSIKPLSTDGALKAIQDADSLDRDSVRSILSDEADFLMSTDDYHLYRTDDTFVSLSDRSTVRTYSNQRQLKRDIDLDNERLTKALTDSKVNSN